MVHWLEDLERKDRHKKQPSNSLRHQDKAFRIKQNYDKNHLVYKRFISEVTSLANRVNNLPLEHRKVFSKINVKEKRLKLNNRLNYFSSSHRLSKTEFSGIFHPFRKVHYKHIRVIFFKLSKIMDKVEVEVKEEYLEKKLRDGKLDDSTHQDSKKNQKGRFHQVYYYEISNLTNEFAVHIIDWLAFQEDVHHLPVLNDGELKPREH